MLSSVKFELKVLKSFNGQTVNQIINRVTKDSSDASIDLTNKSSPHPVILDKGIDGNWKSLSGHHAQVREGQVHDEHVGLKPINL